MWAHRLLPNQGGCSPVCDPMSPETLLSDSWVLRRPSGWSYWAQLASGLPSWGLVDSAHNLWAPVQTLPGGFEASSYPGKRAYASLVSESASSAILFGGAISRAQMSPAFNYEAAGRLAGATSRMKASFPLSSCFFFLSILWLEGTHSMPPNKYFIISLPEHHIKM
eukprot:scaffold271671_cov29-Prasinocladus_malaysianus.AAC.1